MTAKIAVISIGYKPNKIIDNLLEFKDTQLNLILMNMLDYTLPPKVENSVPQKYYPELRSVLKQLGASEYVNISDSLSALLKENDRFGFNEADLALVSHITQIEQNSKSLQSTYQILLEETKKKNISLTPLVSSNPDLLVFKGKKYAPLRYYVQKGELLSENPPETEKKRKYPDKKLTIENMEALNTIKFSENVEKIIEDSNLIIISASDYTSLGTLVISKEIKNQIKKTSTPLVFIWTLDNDVSDEEAKIAEAMGFGTTLSEFAIHLSELTDYVVIDKNKMDDLEALRDEGCKVLVEDIWTDNGNILDKSLNSILSVGGINRDATGINLDESFTTESVTDEGHEKPVKVKPLSQLLESPEESGDTHLKEIPEEEEGEEEKDTALSEENIDDADTENDTENSEISGSTVEGFIVLGEEEWFDTAVRAIELSFDDLEAPAFTWLKEQSEKDNEKEQQIAETLIDLWIESRSTTSRRRGAELIAIMVNNHKGIYQQILQRHLITSVTEKSDEKRRQLILLYHILHEEADIFTQALIGGIVRDLASLDEESDHLDFEIAKLTILRLVMGKKKLSNYAIGELLQVLDNKQGSNAEVWNILTSFDASSVAIELVTRFSTNKLDEITRRSTILRFTGSYYSIISKVIQAWKDGDRVTLSNVIGSILPEATMRKFERMELARSVQKLRMVQINTLADSLGKDVKNVEKLVTELIVNGELQAEFKLIDDKMYLVASDE